MAFDYGWPGVTAQVAQPINAQALATAPGRYRVNGEQFARVAREGERLFLTLGGPPRSELLAVGDNRYLKREQEEARSFGSDDQGRAVLILSNSEGKPGAREWPTRAAHCPGFCIGKGCAGASGRMTGQGVVTASA